jgi:hypothetical protein
MVEVEVEEVIVAVEVEVEVEEVIVAVEVEEVIAEVEVEEVEEVIAEVVAVVAEVVVAEVAVVVAVVIVITVTVTVDSGRDHGRLVTYHNTNLIYGPLENSNQINLFIFKKNEIDRYINESSPLTLY